MRETEITGVLQPDKSVVMYEFFNLLETRTFSPDCDYFYHYLGGSGLGLCFENDGYDDDSGIALCVYGDGYGNGLGRGGVDGIGFGYDFPPTRLRRE